MEAPFPVNPRSGSIDKALLPTRPSQVHDDCEDKESLTIEQRQARIDDIQEDLRVSRKRLRVGPLYDGYAEDMHQIFLKKVKVNHLKVKNSIEAFDGSYEDWQLRGIGADLLREQNATEGELKKWEWQTKQLEKAREFFGEAVEDFKELWKTSSMGWGLKIGFGERDKGAQRSLRDTVFEVYDAFDSDMGFCWCPLIRKWEKRERVKAAHLFPHKSTQKHMTRIFGTKDELSHPRNAMPMADYIEEQFDKGRIALIPNLPEDATDKDWDNWRKDRIVRQYKIRIVNKLAREITTQRIEGGVYRRLTLLELDNKPVEFRNSYRPRARYLFYHYLECLNAQITGYPQMKNEIIYNEIQKPVWPSMGSYIRKGPLMGFIAELGQDMGFVLNQAIEEEESANDLTAADPTMMDVMHSKAAAEMEDSETETDSVGEEDDLSFWDRSWWSRT